MKTILLLCGVIVAGSAGGQETLVTSKERYHLPVSSFFNVKEAARNPFEPIGYTIVAPPKSGEVPACPPDLFNVTSIAWGNPSIAFINGKDYAEGDSVPVPGQNIKVILKKVSDGQIILEHPNQQIGNQGRIVVPLH